MLMLGVVDDDLVGSTLLLHCSATRECEDT